MVMAKLNRMGNCLRFNLKGSIRSSVGDIGICGMKTLVYSMLPVNNLSINTIPHESSDDQTGAIAQSIVSV
jgi:hypothetical protein